MKITEPGPQRSSPLPGKPTTSKSTAPVTPQNSETPDLTQGRLLKGHILSADTDGTTRITIGGKTITAQSLVPLTVGHDIWLEVLQEGKVPLLGLAAKKGAALDVMRQLLRLVGSGGVLSGNNNLAASANNIALEHPQLQHFSSLFNKSRQGAEADPSKLVRTLLLLDLIKLDSENLKESASSLNNKELGSLLKIFESHSHLNSQPPSQEQQSFLLFPCFFEGNCGWGEWMVNLDNGEGSKQRDSDSHSLTFFLEMSNLGEIHINVQTKNETLHGVFSLSNKESLNFLNEHLPALSSLLEKLGYKSVSFSTQLSNTTNFQNLKDALSTQTGNTSFALLDTTI